MGVFDDFNPIKQITDTKAIFDQAGSDLVSSVKDIGSNLATSIQDVGRQVQDPLKQSRDLISDTPDFLKKVGSQEAQNNHEAGDNLATSVQDMGREAGHLDIGQSIANVGNTIGHWGDTAANAQHDANDRIQQSWKNWQNDPMGEVHNLTRMGSGYAASQVQTGANAFSRWTGGGGDGLKDAGVSQDVREEGQKIHGVGVGAGKVVAGAAVAYLAGWTGAGAVGGYLMMADGIDQLQGGNGNGLGHIGMNSNYQGATRLAAAASSANSAGDAAKEGAGSAEISGVTGSATVGDVAGGAASGATYAGVQGGDENQIAAGAVAGGVAGAASGGYANTKTGSIERAATMGGVNAGTGAAVSGKSAAEILKASVLGAAASGGAQTINVGLDVGKGQVAATDKDGNAIYNNDGSVKMESTNSDQHIVNTDNNEPGNSQIYTDKTGHPLNANIDRGANWQLPTAKIASGAWSEGVKSVANGGTFGDGAKVGASGGAVSAIFQGAAQALTKDGTRTSDTAQAAGSGVGNVVGQVAETKAQIDANNKIPDVSLPEFVPNVHGNEGGMLNTNFTVKNTGSKNLNMKSTRKAGG